MCDKPVIPACPAAIRERVYLIQFVDTEIFVGRSVYVGKRRSSDRDVSDRANVTRRNTFGKRRPLLDPWLSEFTAGQEPAGSSLGHQDQLLRAITHQGAPRAVRPGVTFESLLTTGCLRSVRGDDRSDRVILRALSGGFKDLEAMIELRREEGVQVEAGPWPPTGSHNSVSTLHELLGWTNAICV